ncbi:hypothetical protein PCC8801_3306 [Rippkaea orientalis PCC 8801]|uniref:Uncharacterized protein n=1 Tax=Rippkaea orientalis (strain PCC 8801 / RF-1) TaxID=41431 RepID=B7JZ66_RIPO1|nr:hypothetical protein PCC8801_3306 [Rippkaea orientalis PCC 8801]
MTDTQVHRVPQKFKNDSIKGLTVETRGLDTLGTHPTVIRLRWLRAQ